MSDPFTMYYVVRKGHAPLAERGDGARGAAAVRLRPFTDPPRPEHEPPPPHPRALVYAIRPGVIKTAGKATAQAGHAALTFAREHPEAAVAWREAGMPGTAREVEAGEWERLRSAPGAVVVADAGLTQVAAGTETVVALPPRED